MRRNFELRTLLGILLILFGISAFTSQYYDYNLFHEIFSWPAILMIFGIFMLFNSRNKLFGALLFSLGTLLLIARVFNMHGDIFFPGILILLGIYVIFKNKFYSPRRFPTNWVGRHPIIDKDMLDEVAIFGGGNRFFDSQNFKGGDITAIFGGLEIDLTRCALAEGANSIDVLAVFGGTTIIVPKEWDVRLQGTPIFGGFSFKNPNLFMPPVNNPDKFLIIKGLAIFGGVEIKYY